MSLTKRSMGILRKNGWIVEAVERWNAHALTRKDLFNMFDLLAIKDGVTMGVQVTSYANISSRVSKIKSNPLLKHILKAGWIVCVHGWKKDKGRWVCVEKTVGGQDAAI